MEKPRFINTNLGSDGLLKNENPRIKIRSGGLSCSEEWKNQDSLRWASDLWEKRNQDSFGGLPTFGKRGIKICSVGSEFRRTEKNQDSYLRILVLGTPGLFFLLPFHLPLSSFVFSCHSSISYFCRTVPWNFLQLRFSFLIPDDRIDQSDLDLFFFFRYSEMTFNIRSFQDVDYMHDCKIVYNYCYLYIR
ncbi:unnamed protein product [Rhizophagus irregularis]|nr:unnamed protein product [Rhizophagus irregularis]